MLIKLLRYMEEVLMMELDGDVLIHTLLLWLLMKRREKEGRRRRRREEEE